MISLSLYIEREVLVAVHSYDVARILSPCHHSLSSSAFFV